MKPLLLLGLALGAGSAAAAGLMSHASAPTAVISSAHERPGPDSARVATLLQAMATTDPVACELLSNQIGSFWWSDDGWGIGGLADARHEIRAASDSVSGRVRSPGAIQYLVHQLGSENPCIRRTAARMLGNSTVPDARLATLLDDPSLRVREAALLALGSGERTGLRPRIERMLRGNDEAVITMAAWALGEIEDRESVDPLLPLLGHSAPRVRMTAAWALGAIEDPRPVGRLVPLLRDPDPGVRWAAACALGDIERPEAAEPLERRLTEEPDRRVRLQIVEALGDIEQARSAPALARMLNGGDTEIAIAAAEAIGDLDDLEHAPQELLQAINTSNPELRRAVAEALASIEDPATVSTLVQLARDPDPEIRRQAIETLGEIGSRDAVPVITQALEDRDPEVRRAAVEALADIDDE